MKKVYTKYDYIDIYSKLGVMTGTFAAVSISLALFLGFVITLASHAHPDLSSRICLLLFVLNLPVVLRSVKHYRAIQNKLQRKQPDDAEGNVTGGKFGLVNAAGKEVAFLKYDDVAAARQAYRESLEKVRWKKNGTKFALYDKKTGKMVSKTYDKYWEWSGDRAIVSNNQKFGYIDKNGKEIVPVIYDDMKLKHTEEGILAKKDGKWGFVDWQGQPVLPFQYDVLSNILDNGLVAVNIGGQAVNNQGTIDGGLWGYIDIHGRVIAPVKYNYVGSQWTDGMVWVNLGGKINVGDNSVSGGKFGLIDTTGLEVVPVLFSGDQQAREALQKGLGNLFGIGDVIPDQVWDY